MAVSDDAPGPEGWWSEFFTGEHAEFQIAMSEETHDSDAEVELLIRLGRVTSGSRVLDIPCGQGRHAIRLAEAGADVIGVDASSTMLERAMRDAEGRRVQVIWIHSDMRQFEAATPFDVTICLGGSFGYFGRNGDQDFLGTLWHALKPGGILALDMPSFEYIRARHNPRHESSHSHQHVIQQRHLDPETGAARIDVITVSRRGRTPRAYYQQLYRTDEVQEMLASCGFEILEALEASEVPEYRTNVGHVLLVAYRPDR